MSAFPMEPIHFTSSPSACAKQQRRTDDFQNRKAWEPRTDVAKLIRDEAERVAAADEGTRRFVAMPRCACGQSCADTIAAEL
jgi:hypothetical protein